MSRFTEQEVEDLSLEWLGELGWAHVYGPDIEPEEPRAERDSFATVYLAARLKTALRKLNPGLPQQVLDDAYSQITRPTSP